MEDNEEGGEEKEEEVEERTEGVRGGEATTLREQHWGNNTVGTTLHNSTYNVSIQSRASREGEENLGK